MRTNACLCIRSNAAFRLIHPTGNGWMQHGRWNRGRPKAGEDAVSTPSIVRFTELQNAPLGTFKETARHCDYTTAVSARVVYCCCCPFCCCPMLLLLLLLLLLLPPAVAPAAAAASDDVSWSAERIFFSADACLVSTDAATFAHCCSALSPVTVAAAAPLLLPRMLPLLPLLIPSFAASAAPYCHSYCCPHLLPLVLPLSLSLLLPSCCPTLLPPTAPSAAVVRPSAVLQPLD